VTVTCREGTSAELTRDGFAICQGTIDPAALDPAVDALEGEHSQTLASRRAGFRDIFAIPSLAELAQRPELRHLASLLLGKEAFVVRALLFDKSAAANWKVAWHQDLTICVRERIDTAGFGPWSQKEGIPHVQAPVEILDRMIALRLHLDPCVQSNGALRVLPGSHLDGKLTAAAIEAWRRSTPERLCAAARGDILVMRPLLLHASSTASEPSHRRVLHLEFAADELPGGLQWHAMPRQREVAPRAPFV
jgi:ectoine hydroxylase-related dioxygenase (phytanoyl-CoA dioxygenase family)